MRVGVMSECPSYLGITINDRLQSEQLIDYDLVVFCPPRFSVTFWLPNWGQRSARTFDVQLRDSQRTHVVFLTRLMLERRQSDAPTTSTPRGDGDGGDRELPALLAAGAGVTLTLILLVLTLFVRLCSPCASRRPASTVQKRARGRRCRVCAYATASRPRSARRMAHVRACCCPRVFVLQYWSCLHQCSFITPLFNGSLFLPVSPCKYDDGCCCLFDVNVSSSRQSCCQ